jgi:DNA-binding SARP family transcriptional activator
MLRFHLLCPLEVLRDGEPCTPTASMQRALLAVLVQAMVEAGLVSRYAGGTGGQVPRRSDR